MDHFSFDRALICGIGLIGSSLARGLRTGHREGRIGGRGWLVGVDRDPQALARALALGVIDEMCLLPAVAVAEATADPVGSEDAKNAGVDIAAAAAGADLIVLAVPVAQTRRLLASLATQADWASTLVITDVGSTKGDVCAAAIDVLGPRAARFVAGHPIAGAEASGVDAGCDTLFVDRDIVLCPIDRAVPEAGAVSSASSVAVTTDADALARVAAMWQQVGGRVATMTAARHDQIFASVSHLPHLLAFGFIAHILDQDGADERFALAGSGFRDFSRIAASNPEMWRDVCLANRDAILSDLDHYLQTLGRLREAIAGGDALALDTAFSRARRARAAWQPRLPRARAGDDAPLGD